MSISRATEMQDSRAALTIAGLVLVVLGLLVFASCSKGGAGPHLGSTLHDKVHGTQVNLGSIDRLIDRVLALEAELGQSEAERARLFERLYSCDCCFRESMPDPEARP